MVSVGKLSIGMLIFWFIFYIVTHYGIGKYKEYLEKENKIRPGNKEGEKLLKNINILFKWYPGIYLILVVIILSLI